MTETLPLIEVSQDDWQIIQGILQKHVAQYPVWAFGSRVTGNAKPYSDLDLAIITVDPLPLSTLGALKDDFAESNLPWKVDVVDWATTSEAFRNIILQNYVVAQS